MRKHSWGLLVLAFLLAILLWIFVVREDNPNIQINLGEIPITVLHEETLHQKNLAYVLKSKEISVTVTVSQIDGWKVSADDIKLVVDLSEYQSDNQTIPIEVRFKKNSTRIKNYNLSENSVVVETQVMTQKTLDVELNLKGEPEERYLVTESKTDPTNIVVKAPNSIIDQIARAEVDVDISSCTDDCIEEKSVVLYDDEGKSIDISKEQIILSRDTVNVSIQIDQQKEVGIELPTVTKCKEGYRYIEMTSSLSNVVVLGKEDILKTVDKISLQRTNLDLKNAITDVKKPIHYLITFQKAFL
ncbi:putative secreted protein [Lachnospiraceae bacterium TWA4]|nr:putative secreted protein [Lachnospiraceae bacterium TWA4]